MIPICPKCKLQYEERDNFCIECGKNLRIIKMQENKKVKNRNEKNRYL